MRKVKLLAALVLVLAVMVALKCCNGKEKETPEALTNDQEAVETIAKPDGEEVPLGVVAENESGGVSITVTGEDGAQKTYVFEDVAPDSWYIDAVNYVVSTGLMKGSEDAPLFQPEYGIQRVQFAAVLYRLAGGEHEVAKNKFSKCYRFMDINYSTSNEEEQIGIFERYCKFLNSLDCEFKIIINNRNKDKHPPVKICSGQITRHRTDKQRIYDRKCAKNRQTAEYRLGDPVLLPENNHTGHEKKHQS